MENNNTNNKYNTRGCLSIKSDAADTHCCNLDEASKLHVTDWMKDVPVSNNPTTLVEVRFKNTRKGIYNNVNLLSLNVGDIVAVEASPGHDIGIVTLTGELVLEQMRRNGIDLKTEFKKVYRKAKSTDVEKWKEAINLEHETMIKSRKLSADLRLNMKIGDVEYQGDRTKAIFYYIADDRVDFRELIRVLADSFKVRIEMKQIGARQEAGRIGGIGSCGRELCCSSWLVNFVSVSTGSAKMQELSLNPKKLAGQCIKLKCCLNYELDSYMDERKDFPDINITLETQQGPAHHFKTDVHRRLMWYGISPGHNEPMKLIPLAVEKVKEIQMQNKKGIKVKQLEQMEEEVSAAKIQDQSIPSRFSQNLKGDRQQNQNRNQQREKQPNPNQTREPRRQGQGQQGSPRPPQGNQPRRPQDPQQNQPARADQPKPETNAPDKAPEEMKFIKKNSGSTNV